MTSAVEQLAAELMKLPDAEWERLAALRLAGREADDESGAEAGSAAAAEDLAEARRVGAGGTAPAGFLRKPRRGRGDAA